MVQKKTIYYIGAVLLFIGLLWVFLPHASHAQVTETLTGHGEEEEETEHYIHLLQGLIAIIAGLILMFYTEDRTNTKFKQTTKRL